MGARPALRYGRALVERSRWLGAYLGDPVEQSPAIMRERAVTLMTETAISGWLGA